MIGLEKADGAHMSPKGLEEHGARLFTAYRELTGESEPNSEHQIKNPEP